MWLLNVTPSSPMRLMSASEKTCNPPLSVRFGPVKAMILSLDAGSLRGRLEELLESKNTSLREDLRRFAVEKGVQI